MKFKECICSLSLLLNIKKKTIKPPRNWSLTIKRACRDSSYHKQNITKEYLIKQIVEFE